MSTKVYENRKDETVKEESIIKEKEVLKRKQWKLREEACKVGGKNTFQYTSNEKVQRKKGKRWGTPFSCYIQWCIYLCIVHISVLGT